MRFLIPLFCLALTVGCASQGPGADCDPCAQAEAKPVGDNSQAAAASAAGGQRANQAPFVEDTVSPRVKTTVGRGAGDTSSMSADTEHRAVSSGGAQNLALMNPATATASTSGGGVSAAVQEAQKTVASWRSALMLAMTDQHVDMEKLDFIKSSLLHAQSDLNAAQAAQAESRPNVTHNYNMGGDNTIVGYSRAGNGEGPDSPEATKVLGEAAQSAFARNEAQAKAAAARKADESPDADQDGQ